MKFVSADKVKFVKRARPSKYQMIFDQMQKLKPGQALLMDGGKDPKSAISKLTQAIVSTGPAAPSGYRWSKRRTEDEQIAVSLVGVEVAKPTKKKKKTARKR